MNFNLGIQTKHLALLYYSTVTQKREIKNSIIKVVLFLCFFLASKFTGECSNELITYKNSVLRNCLTPADIIEIENYIISSLEWKCSLVTSGEILDLLANIYGINEELRKKSLMIIDFCLTGNLNFILGFLFIKWKPSVLAYASLMVATEIINNSDSSLFINDQPFGYYNKEYLVSPEK